MLESEREREKQMETWGLGTAEKLLSNRQCHYVVRERESANGFSVHVSGFECACIWCGYLGVCVCVCVRERERERERE